MKPTPGILLTEGISHKASAYFENHNLRVVSLPHALGAEEFVSTVHEENIIAFGGRSKTAITADMLDQVKDQLICLSRFCIGTDSVDLTHAAKLGIPVFNSPFGNTNAVKELTIAEVIFLVRNVAQRARDMVERGLWSKTKDNANEIRGKTLGIIGYGNIGSQLGDTAQALGMDVVYTDVRDVLPRGRARQVSLNELLQQSDVVSLHVPGGHDTQNMIGAKEIAQMKKGAILVNNSRGTVVDLVAVREALDQGHLKGAAVDVFPEEPGQAEAAFKDHPLYGIQGNVILTPHIGGATEEAQDDIGIDAARKMVNLLLHWDTSGALNMPKMYVGELKENIVRVLSVHDDEPGYIANVTQHFASAGINITGQSLQTEGNGLGLGYAVFDIRRDTDRDVQDWLRDLMNEIGKVSGTKSFKVIPRV